MGHRRRGDVRSQCRRDLARRLDWHDEIVDQRHAGPAACCMVADHLGSVGRPKSPWVYDASRSRVWLSSTLQSPAPDSIIGPAASSHSLTGGLNFAAGGMANNGTSLYC